MSDIMQLRAVWPFWSPRGRFRGWETTPVSGESGAAARPHVRTGGGVLQEAAGVQSSSLALLRGRPAPEQLVDEHPSHVAACAPPYARDGSKM